MGTTMQFDTLRYVEKLIAAGIPEGHAKASAEALVMALNESASGYFATKDDISAVRGDVTNVRGDLANLKIEMAGIRSDLKLTKWMTATIVAGVISLVVKTFFWFYV